MTKLEHLLNRYIELEGEHLDKEGVDWRLALKDFVFFVHYACLPTTDLLGRMAESADAPDSKSGSH